MPRPAAATSAAVPAAGGTESGQRAPGSLLLPALLGIIAAAEAAALAVLLVRPEVPVAELAAVHAATLAALALLLALFRHRGEDATLPLLALVAASATGPLGPLGVAAMALAGRRPPQPSQLVADWYERISLATTIDRETRLCEDVGVGRTLDLGAGKPAAFPSVMASGPLAARQAILGLIARQFHPLYLDTLKVALRSPEPGIRVQAAAVATHIGPDLRRRFEACAAAVGEAGPDPLAALGLLGELEALVDSGLLDAGDRQRGADLAAYLGDRILEAAAGDPLAMPHATDPAGAAQLEQTFERLLVTRGQFAALRSRRSRRRILARHPGARLKRLAARSRLPETVA